MQVGMVVSYMVAVDRMAKSRASCRRDRLGVPDDLPRKGSSQRTPLFIMQLNACSEFPVGWILTILGVGTLSSATQTSSPEIRHQSQMRKRLAAGCRMETTLFTPPVDNETRRRIAASNAWRSKPLEGWLGRLPVAYGGQRTYEVRCTCPHRGAPP